MSRRLLDDGELSEDGTQTQSESDDEETWQSKAEELKKSSTFQLCVAFAIAMSTVSMAGETDYEEWPGWTWLNAGFLLFFIFEISIRIVAEGCYFASCSNPDFGWNAFDFSIVSVSLFDWTVSTFTADKGGMMKYVLVLRTVRILRILRVLRLFKSFKQLSLLVQGLMVSFRSVIWIGIMIFMVMLGFAIFIREQVGEVKRTDFEDEEEYDEYYEFWGSVGRCLVTLFQFLTFDDWSETAALITQKDGMGYMIFIFWAYMFIAAFAMLGLLTGVITDHMSEVSKDQKKQTSDDQDDDLDAVVDEYRARFKEVHPRISRVDFENLVQRESPFGRKLRELNVSVLPADVDDIFECLDKDRKGFINWEELSAGLKRMRGELQAKDILRIRFAAARVAALLGAGDEATTKQKLNEVQIVMDGVDKGLRNLTKQLQGFVQDRHGSGGFGALMLGSRRSSSEAAPTTREKVKE